MTEKPIVFLSSVTPEKYSPGLSRREFPDAKIQRWNLVQGVPRRKNPARDFIVRNYPTQKSGMCFYRQELSDAKIQSVNKRQGVTGRMIQRWILLNATT